MIIDFEKIPFGEVQNDLFTTTDGGLAFILSEPFRLRLYCSTSPAVRTMPMPSIQFSRKFHKKKTLSQEMKASPEGDGHRRWHHDVSSLFRCPFKYFFFFLRLQIRANKLFSFVYHEIIAGSALTFSYWPPTVTLPSMERLRKKGPTWRTFRLSVGVYYRCWGSS